jgi:hypothetical protein
MDWEKWIQSLHQQTQQVRFWRLDKLCILTEETPAKGEFTPTLRLRGAIQAF